jgi:hypothetical protein
MWMEERIGKRINTERIDEALSLNPDTVSTACPYCMVMLGDAVAAKKGSGEAKESLEVIDVAQLLARSVTRNGAKAAVGANGAAPAGGVTSAGEGVPTTDGETTRGDGAASAGSDSGAAGPEAPKDAGESA